MCCPRSLGPQLEIRWGPEAAVRRMPAMQYRHATATDTPGIPALHADSWRRNYRGAYLDSYLDGDVETERLAVWADRLARPRADRFTLVAEHDGAVAAFVHTVL